MEKILIVEDNHINYLVLEEMLAEYAFELHWAQNGEEFYKYINESCEYDLVLMDIMLPDTDGIELAKYMLNHNIKIPIVFISAYTERCEEIFDLGIEYFLTKPIYRELFFSVIGKFVSFRKKEMAG